MVLKKENVRRVGVEYENCGENETGARKSGIG